MNRQTPGIILAVAALGLGALACVTPLSAASTPTPQVITVVVEPTQAPTDVPSPTATNLAPTASSVPTATQNLPTATTGPQCTILKRVNFRSGPGTAYNPPMGALEAGTLVIPKGYNPTGIPGGAWAQVLDPASNQLGWVSAGADFMTCNIDLASLPQVAVAPPPPPPRPQVSNSQPDGSANGLVGDFIFSPDFLLRMAVHLEGETEDGKGIQEVAFSVEDLATNKIIYERTERTAGYCIFGGGEPDCNPWPQTNYVITWGDGGPPVVDGVYNVRIAATGDGDATGNWNYDLTVDVP